MYHIRYTPNLWFVLEFYICLFNYINYARNHGGQTQTSICSISIYLGLIVMCKCPMYHIWYMTFLVTLTLTKSKFIRNLITFPYLLFFRPIVPTSICLSRYLFLILWAEFNQTCYMTSPHGKGVREQHYFSVCLSVCSSIYSLRYLLLNHLAEFDQTCYMHSPREKVCESNIIFLSVRPFVCLTVMLCPPKPLGWI